MQMYRRAGTQAGVWIACLLGEVAHMHVGASSFFSSPNMAVKRGACLWRCMILWTDHVWDYMKVTVCGGETVGHLGACKVAQGASVRR